MEIITHFIQVSFYWYLCISGGLPMSYKMKEKYYKPHTCTWKISKIGMSFCFIHILIIFPNIIKEFRNYEGKFELLFNTYTLLRICGNLLKLTVLSMAMMNIVIMITRRKEMEKLLNDINALYTRVLIITDKSRLKGSWICAFPIVTYFIFTLTVKIMSLYAYRNELSISSMMQLLNIFIMYWYEMTTYCAEPLASVLFVSLEIIIDAIRFGMETDLPSVSQYDWECWTNKREYLKIDKVNLFVMFTYNQITCVIYAFYVINFTTNQKNLDEKAIIRTLFFFIYSVVVISRNIYLCHRSEQVTVKAKRLVTDAALLDSSKIDDESKIQLIHFLQDANEENFRISILNVFFLDYRQMFFVLSVTSTYILIILQYVNPPR